MRTTAWIAYREIGANTSGFALATSVVAIVVLFVLAMDGLARHREEVVAERLDRISPPIEVLPVGVSAMRAARGAFGSALLPSDTMVRTQEVLGRSLRAVEPRLVLEASLDGVATLLVGVPKGTEQLSGLGRDEVAAGALLGQRLVRRSGARLALLGEEVRVGALLHPTGSIEDTAAFLPLERLQRLVRLDGRINQLRVFLHAGADAAGAQATLEGALAANVVRHDRGGAVERDSPRSLALWRAATFSAAGLACGAWLAFAARLNLTERRRELATLTAIGMAPRQIVGVVVLRSAATASAGAILGAAGGLVAMRLLDAQGASLHVLASATAATVMLSVLIAAPIGLLAARADPTGALEER